MYTQTNEIYCTDCGNMLGANGICQRCGKQSPNVAYAQSQNNSYQPNQQTGQQGIGYSQVNQPYSFQPNPLIQSYNAQMLNKKPKALSTLSIVLIVVSAIMAFVICFSFLAI